MKKRIIAFMLSLVMVFSCCNLGDVLAAEGTGESCGEFATYELSEEGVLVISGTGTVESAWEDIADEITAVVIEEGITALAGSVFEDCVNLAEVELPESLEGIGQDAFYGCTSLEEIILPEFLVKIGSSAFEGCKNLKKVVLPESVSILEEDVFSRCTSLDVITIPESVEVIKGSAFYKVPLIHNLSDAEGSPWGALKVHSEPADNCQKCFTGDFVCEHEVYTEKYDWTEDKSACTATLVCDNCQETHVLACEVKVETTEATCTENGKTVYTATCELGEDSYVDEIVDVIEAPGHQWDEGVVTKEPTEEATGTFVYTCTVCEEKKEEVLEKLEHEYAVTDQWSEDKLSCTAIFTCLNCGDVQEVECTVKSNTTEATCTEDGNTVYVATCEFNGTKHVMKCEVEDVIPAKGHSFASEPTWDWAEDMKTATASFACSACEEVEVLECNVISQKVDDKIIYTVECEFEDEVHEASKVQTVIPFTDVQEGKWYYDYVVWGYENGIANGFEQADGTYIFQPNANCTRAQFVQFLYSIAGTVVEDAENPFTDIKEGKWYYEAVIWAVENGVASGFEEKDGTYTFRPDETCTRAQAAQFIYNLLGEDAVVEDVENPFTDINEGKWYYNAVLWGYEEGIISGIKQTDDTYKFAPDDNVTRAQVVTMISSAYDDAAVAGIALTETEIVLTRGNKYQLDYVLNPSYAANKEVKWASSDKTIAKVSSLGVVTAVGYGSVTITATTVDGGFVASCVVNVIDPELVVEVDVDLVWVAVDGKDVQSLAITAIAEGGSEVYDEYTIQVYEADTLVLEEESETAVLTPAVDGTTYTVAVTVKDSRGAEATTEKEVIFK